MKRITKCSIYVSILAAVFFASCGKQDQPAAAIDQKKPEQKNRQRVGAQSSGDDQPVTISGGSLLLGSDPSADWDYDGAGKKLVYSSSPGLTAELVEIVSADSADTDTAMSLTRIPQTALEITILFGPGPSKGHKIKLSTDASGGNLALSMTAVVGGAALDPSHFMRILPSLRRHPKKNWQIQTVTFSGVYIKGGTVLPIIPAPSAGDFSLVMHYCRAGFAPCN